MENFNNENNQPTPTQYIRMPERQELIFNFWLIFNECGVLTSGLLVKEYLATGSEDDKWNMLCERAETDIELAKRFDIPKRYRLSFALTDGTEMKIPYVHTSVLRHTRGGRRLFTEAINKIKKQYAQKQDVYVPYWPLYHITELFTKLEFVSDCPLYEKFAMNINRTDI
jgi:hypothetical protein